VLAGLRSTAFSSVLWTDCREPVWSDRGAMPWLSASGW